ncbi:MAG: putative toxin-antitoxin system toxin component, PIN family [Candidatus Omnitrophica bacterium]|nr:putative toxin-antitoxin system toxin component, PIN family [Candidatus Omnitrophota bacterium]
MRNNPWKVFIDTNVIISGLMSHTGASAVILDLGEAEEILIIINQHILVEADRIFLTKFPHLVDQFRYFIKNLSPLLLDDPKPKAVHAAQKIIEIGDAPILATLKSEKIDYFVTLDTKHFKTPQVTSYIETPILTPGEFLKKFQKFWEQSN